MTGTLLFVHGTGVRESAYVATLQQIRDQVGRLSLPVNVAGCYWGSAEGAKLAAGGVSVPDYQVAGGSVPNEAEEVAALWSLLYTDPWYELRLLRHYPRATQQPFGLAPSSEQLRQEIEELKPSGDLHRLLDTHNLSDAFDQALAELKRAPELSQALASAPPDPLEHRKALGRALIAQTALLAENADRPAIHGSIRDQLVEALTVDLNGYGLGIGEFLTRPIKGIAGRMLSRRVLRHRGSITDSAAPMAGDILKFLANGDGIREYVRAALTDATPGPIHLLGHSLGGVICVDILLRNHFPEVSTLTTVGSQAPFLYEIGALPGLHHPNPLPAHFPRWLNVFDRADILSYKGSGLFPDRVKDVEVDNCQPFPQSHSAYWTNQALWSAIQEAL